MFWRTVTRFCQTPLSCVVRSYAGDNRQNLKPPVLSNGKKETGGKSSHQEKGDEEESNEKESCQEKGQDESSKEESDQKERHEKEDCGSIAAILGI